MDYYNFAVDLILVVIFFATVVSGYRKGLVKLLISAIAFVVSLFIARWAAPSIAQWIYDNILEQHLAQAFAQGVNDAASATVQSVAAALPDYVVSLVESAGFTVESLMSEINLSAQDAVAVTDVFEPIVVSGVQLAAFAVTAFLIYTVLKFISAPLRTIFKLPLLKQVNGLLGMVFATVKGAAIVVVISYALAAAASFAAGSTLAQFVDSSKVVAFVCENVNNFVL